MKMFGAAHHWMLLLVSPLIILVVFDSRPVQAASIYVWLVIDPATTAGFGVPTIPSGGSNLAVSSNRSGPGTFHMFALDDVAGSSGIRNYSVTVSGASSITHRSPVGQYDDNASFGNGNGPFSVGFGDLRSGANVSPLVAGQGVSNSPQIGGFGISAGNFGAKIGAAAQSYSGVTSGQWGNYSPYDGLTSGVILSGTGASGQIRTALFIAEGQYTGTAPIITSASFAYWTNAQLTASAFAPSYILNTDPWLVSPPQFPVEPEPATLTLLGIAVVGFGSKVRRRRA